MITREMIRNGFEKNSNHSLDSTTSYRKNDYEQKKTIWVRKSLPVHFLDPDIRLRLFSL